MTPEKCRETMEFYRKNLIRLFYNGIEDIVGKRPEIVKPKPFADNETLLWPIDQEKGLAHLFYMLDMMEKFLDEGQTEKAYGWLCFIQGVCWGNSYQTIGELKKLNKPDPNTGEATVGDPSKAEIAF